MFKTLYIFQNPKLANQLLILTTRHRPPPLTILLRINQKDLVELIANQNDLVPRPLQHLIKKNHLNILNLHHNRNHNPERLPLVLPKFRYNNNHFRFRFRRNNNSQKLFRKIRMIQNWHHHHLLLLQQQSSFRIIIRKLISRKIIIIILQSQNNNNNFRFRKCQLLIQWPQWNIV